MSDVEAKAVELMDKAANGVEALSAKLATIAEQYGPEVVDAGLAVARITAVRELVFAFIGWVTVAVFIGVCFLVWKKTESWKQDDVRGVARCSTIIGAIAGTTLVSFFGFGAPRFFDVWTWVGVFEPKLWIAHRILGW